MATEFEADVLAWLEQGGRPLEMRVAAQLEKASRDAMSEPAPFDRPIWWRTAIRQSPFFEDPDEGKPREIDVVALFSDPTDDLRVVSIVVECKSKPEPFVVLLPGQFEPSRFRCLSEQARARMPATNQYGWRSLKDTPLFDFTVPVGHTVLAKGSREDGGWKAAMSAGKAASWFATRRDALAKGAAEIHAAFPVVVTNGKLATAELIGGELQVHEVDHARCVLQWPIDDSTPALIVDIVVADAFADFAAGCCAAAGALLKHWREVEPGDTH